MLYNQNLYVFNLFSGSSVFISAYQIQGSRESHGRDYYMRCVVYKRKKSKMKITRLDN